MPANVLYTASASDGFRLKKPKLDDLFSARSVAGHSRIVDKHAFCIAHLFLQAHTNICLT